jgi:hypothetical protein
MTYEPTNAELYCVIQRLCCKIETLEKKVDKLNQDKETNIDKIRLRLGLETPDVYSNWLSFIKVDKKHYNDLFSQHGCVITTFKDIVLEHMNLSDELPLYKYKKRVYVYQTVGDENEWCLIDNDNLVTMVKQVWQKLLSFQLSVIYDDTEDDDIKDQKRRVVLQMRQRLCDVKCNRDSIMKWIKEVV